MKKKYSYEEKVLLSLPREYCKERWSFNKKKVLKNVNWRVLFIFAKRNSLFNFVYLMLHNYMPEKHKSSFQKEYIRNQKIHDFYLLELQDIYRENVEFDIVLNKGFALSQVLYGNIYTRNVIDIDLIAEEKHLEKVDALLRKNNYEPFDYESGEKQDVFKFQYKPKTIVPKEGKIKYETIDGHELNPYRKETKGVWLEVELARHLHIIQKEIPRFLDHVVKLKIRDADVKCFDNIHLFLALIDNTFQNSETFNGIWNLSSSVRDYIDIYNFLKEIINEKIFFQVIQKSIEYHFVLELQRVMENLNCLFQEQFIRQYLKLIQKNIRHEKSNIESSNYFIPWKTKFGERVFNPYKAQIEFFDIIDRDRLEGS